MFGSFLNRQKSFWTSQYLMSMASKFSPFAIYFLSLFSTEYEMHILELNNVFKGHIDFLRVFIWYEVCKFRLKVKFWLQQLIKLWNIKNKLKMLSCYIKLKRDHCTPKLHFYSTVVSLTVITRAITRGFGTLH